MKSWNLTLDLKKAGFKDCIVVTIMLWNENLIVIKVNAKLNFYIQ